MLVRFNVDRVASFRSKVSATAECRLEVDPASLSDADRELLASRLNQAGDVCARSSTANSNLGLFYAGSYFTQRPSESKNADIVLAKLPTIESLMDAIREEEASISSALEKQAKYEAERLAKIRAETLAVLKARKTTDGRVSRQGQVQPDGTVSVAEYVNGKEDAACSAAYPMPAWPYRSDPEVVASPEAVAWEAELKAAGTKIIAELEERTRVAALQAVAEKAAVVAERENWIRANGSDRLRRCLAEGIEHAAAYRDERLNAERPGWQWYKAVEGEYDEPRNPPLEAFATLDEARKVDPEAKLVHVEGDGYAAAAEFLGVGIVYGWPEPKVEEDNPYADTSA